MARTSCPACGATVDVAKTTDGETVALEVHTDSSSEADRYRIVGLNPLTVEQVAKKASGDYYPAHDFDCPAGNAGHVIDGG